MFVSKLPVKVEVPVPASWAMALAVMALAKMSFALVMVKKPRRVMPPMLLFKWMSPVPAVRVSGKGPSTVPWTTISPAPTAPVLSAVVAVRVIAGDVKVRVWSLVTTVPARLTFPPPDWLKIPSEEIVLPAVVVKRLPLAI